MPNVGKSTLFNALSKLNERCHISEVSDARIADLTKHYAIGDKVRAKVVKLDEQTKKVSLGLKAKYFEGLEPASDAEEEEDAEEAGDSDEEAEDDEAAAGSDDEAEAPELNIEEDEEEAAPTASAKKLTQSKKAAAAAAAEAESSEEEEEVEMDDSRPSKKARASAAAASAAASSASSIPALPSDEGEMADAPALDLNSSFSMLTGSRHSAVPAADEEDATDSDDEDDEAAAMDDDATGSSAAKKKSRRAKGAAKKAEERALIAREQAIPDPTAQPESADDFKSSLVQDPKSWIKWNNFSDYNIPIEEVRELAGDALKSISFRLPQEKLNVWIALLNLENMYGTAASIKETFNKAAQYNEPLTIYLEMAKIYAATNKMEFDVAFAVCLQLMKPLGHTWLKFAIDTMVAPPQRRRYHAVFEEHARYAAELNRRQDRVVSTAPEFWDSPQQHDSYFKSLKTAVASHVRRGRRAMVKVIEAFGARPSGDVAQIIVDFWTTKFQKCGSDK